MSHGGRKDGGQAIREDAKLPKGGEASSLSACLKKIHGKENKVLTGFNLQLFLPQNFKRLHSRLHAGHARMKVASSCPMGTPKPLRQDHMMDLFKAKHVITHEYEVQPLLLSFYMEKPLTVIFSTQVLQRKPVPETLSCMM